MKKQHRPRNIPEKKGLYKPRKEKPSLAWEHLTVRPLDCNDDELPVIQVKSPTWSPLLYRKRLGPVPEGVGHGQLVRLIDPDGNHYGYGLYNPRAEIAVRVLSKAETPPGKDWWKEQLALAIDLRVKTLKLDQMSNAYRLVHAEGDRLPGLVIDRYGDTLSAEIFSLGMYQRRAEIMELALDKLKLSKAIMRTGPNTVSQEGFEGEIEATSGVNAKMQIQEWGTAYEIDFSTGHKTGFFVDQRENRALVAKHAAGLRMLDLCCYSGGFSVHAKKGGQAGEVTAVDLDENAIGQAKRNARINQVNVKAVHADIFPYVRDLVSKQEVYDIVVLDPPKLIHQRTEMEEGVKRYFDMNRLAMQTLKSGSLFLTCSCSGLLSMFEFQKLVSAAAPQGHILQILEKRGAGGDHPIATNCPETEYLKALWCRMV